MNEVEVYFAFVRATELVWKDRRGFITHYEAVCDPQKRDGFKLTLQGYFAVEPGSSMLALETVRLDELSVFSAAPPSEPVAHVAHCGSLARFGTGHPSEQPCIICGRPTYDIIDRYQTAGGKPLCSKACFDRVLSAPAGAYDGERAKHDREPEGTRS